MYFISIIYEGFHQYGARAYLPQGLIHACGRSKPVPPMVRPPSGRARNFKKNGL